MKKVSPRILISTVLLGLTMGMAAAAEGYFVQADVVRSGEGQPRGPVCVPNAVFQTGEGAVFRVRVIDAETGEELTRQQIQERGVTVMVQVADNEPLPAIFIPHPPEAPVQVEYWTALWMIPEGYPTGNAPWSVHVSDAQGNETEFTPIGQEVGLGVLQVVAGEPQ